MRRCLLGLVPVLVPHIAKLPVMNKLQICCLKKADSPPALAFEWSVLSCQWAIYTFIKHLRPGGPGDHGPDPSCNAQKHFHTCLLQASLPQRTPSGLVSYRERELQALRGPQERRTRKEGDRIYDYQAGFF